MSKIHFQTTPFEINSRMIIRLPADASAQLSSRGMIIADIAVQGFIFQAPLEPDGQRSHWFEITRNIYDELGTAAGGSLTFDLQPAKEWPKPQLPADIQAGLALVPEANALWQNITPKAQWEWLRWIRATKNPDTRQKHIAVACSKLKSGMRRPCCFNSSMCTDMSVANNGVLLVPQTVS